MCKCGCSEAVSVPVGPQGPAGVCECSGNIVGFVSTEEVVPSGVYNFNLPAVTSSGFYLLMFEGTAYSDLEMGLYTIDVITQLINNNVGVTGNTNYSHQTLLTGATDLVNIKNTITHTARVQLTAGNIPGFKITTGATFVDNCSITLYKL